MDDAPPWPKPGDNLLAPGPDWQMNACLNWTHDAWGLYQHGYRRAATLLHDHIQETSSFQDSLVYPFVFLWRQYVELCLKRCIHLHRLLTDSPGMFPPNHNILALWNELRPGLTALDPAIVQDCDSVGEIITQFANVDPGSFTFRYPCDKQGSQALDPSLRYLNIGRFHEAMERIGNFLDASDSALSQALEYKDREDG